jgi:hypothetical protein
MVIRSTASSPESDTDAFVAALLQEATQTYEALSTTASQSTLSLDDFRNTYVTLALEEETRKILRAKGLNYDHLGIDAPIRNVPGGKKDAPLSVAGLFEQWKVQRLQAELIKTRDRDDKKQMKLNSLNQSLFVREIVCADPVYTENWYAPLPKCSPSSPSEVPCRRMIRDSMASPDECDKIMHSSEKAMIDMFHQGGATSLVPDKSSEARFGSVTMESIVSLQVKIRAQLEVDFGLGKDSLFDSGMLLTRLSSDYADDKWEVNHDHVYWNAHVDKANIASYDYSALLYLNGNFEGGHFSFVDSDVDRWVQPKCGRLLAFSSGFENLHRVEKVLSGKRFVLAMWFTCSEKHGYQKYSAKLSGA